MQTQPALPTARPPSTKGRIIAYCTDVSAGVIMAIDGKKYVFFRKEWRNAQPPSPNAQVAFEIRMNAASNIVMA